MPRKPHARVVLNRSRLNIVGEAVANGVEEVLRAVVEEARPPDATPYGQGLVTEGGWLVYHGSKKIGGGSLRGTQPRKPRSFRVSGGRGISGVAGFGFPGRLQETGTIHHAAQPFLWPAWLRVEPDLARIMRPAVKARMATVRG